MEFNLKKENRKKFQDKSKLKRHHKKNYSKVIPKSNEQEEQQQAEDHEETEYEDVSEPELDQDGNFVLREDEIEDINEEGQKVVRRKKIDKFKTNDWRYRNEDVHIVGLDQDEEEFVKSIDFKKLDFNTIDSKQGKKPKDYKKLDRDELHKISIVDERFDTLNTAKEIDSEDDLEALLALTVRDSKNTSPTRKEPLNAPKPPSKTPTLLKSDEAFLDDLI